MITFHQLQSSIQERDYLSLENISLQPTASAGDIYAKISTLISLEKLNEAQKELDRYQPLLPPSLHKFLTTDLESHASIEPENTLVAFLELLPEFHDSSFFRGEIYFLSGLVALEIENAKLALSFMRAAERLFLSLNFLAHTWLAKFNQALALKRIGHQEEYSNLQVSLKQELGSLKGSAKARALWLMASLKIAESENEEAKIYLKQALRLYLSLNDKNGEECARIDLAYLYLLEEKEPKNCGLSTSSEGFKTVKSLSFIHSLGENELRNRENFRKALEAPRSPTHWSLLLESYLHKLKSHSLHEILLRSLREARKSPSFSKLLPFKDLRYFEAYACFNLGKMERFFFLLDQLEKGPDRLHSASLLAELQALPFESAKSAKVIRLNVEKNTIQVGNKITELKRNPLLLDFLVILFSNPNGIKVEDMSEILHGIKFNEDRGNSRMESILFRARSLLGQKDTILLERGFLSLKPGLKFQLVDRKSAKRGVEERRRAILLQAQNAPAGLRLSDFQKVIPTARRTLQQDLQVLVESKELHAQGKNKHRIYSAIPLN